MKRCRIIVLVWKNIHLHEEAEIEAEDNEELENVVEEKEDAENAEENENVRNVIVREEKAKEKTAAIWPKFSYADIKKDGLICYVMLKMIQKK